MIHRPQRIWQPIYEIWGIFQFLTKSKNHINHILFQEVFFVTRSILLTIIIFGKVLLRHKSSEILHDYLQLMVGCGEMVVG